MTDGLCTDCHERSATEAVSASTLHYVHGLVDRVCRACALVRAIAEARRHVALLPMLEAELGELRRLDDDDGA